jgi:phage shock protein E
MNNNQGLYKMKNILKKHMYRESNQISYVEAKEIINKNPLAILVDVRSKQEYKEYHLNGAICIPTYELTKKIPKIIKNGEQIIIIYCQCGIRSKKAIAILSQMGYKNLYEIKGGLDAM